MLDGYFGNINAAGYVSAQGNINGNNIQAGRQVSAAGNITGGNIRTAGIISANGTVTGAAIFGNSASISGNIVGGYLIGNGVYITGITASSTNTANTVTGNSQLNINQVGTLYNLSVSGVVRTQSIVANIINATNYVTVAGAVSAYGNISGQYLFGNGAFLTGVTPAPIYTVPTVTANAQPNITQVGTLTSLSVLGTTSTFNLTAQGSIVAQANVQGQYLFGNGAYLTGISAGTNSATVTANAQPNITSVGTLTSLSVSGTVSIGGNIPTTSNIARNITVSNVAPNPIQGNVGDIWYQTY
jgi:hypothetical protein